MKYKLGTRGSALALAQSNLVKKILEEAYDTIEIELVVIQTKGDIHLDVSLDKLDDKGVFVKEIEEQLLLGSIDLAVHSMKDMPSLLDERLCFTKTLLREDARDVLILKEASSLKELPLHARIATGSIRRSLQLLRMRPDIEICGIRGNIETRIQKMYDEQFDGIVLAAAGIHRLHLEKKITAYFEEDDMIPACGQGALAIEIRKDRVEIAQLIDSLSNTLLDREVQIERQVLKQMDAGCHTPIGVRAHIQDDKVSIHAMYGRDGFDTYACLKRTYVLQDIQEHMIEFTNDLRQAAEEIS